MSRKILKLLNICLYLALHIADAYVPYTSCTDLLYWDAYLCILYNVYVRGWASMEISRRNCCIKGNATKLLSSGMQAVCRFAINSFSTSFQDRYHLFIIFKGRLKTPVFLSRWVSRWTERRKKLWNVTQKLSLFFFSTKHPSTDAFLILLSEWVNTLFQCVLTSRNWKTMRQTVYYGQANCTTYDICHHRIRFRLSCQWQYLA